MEKVAKFILTEEEKNFYTETLVNELVTLRAKADISQDELANAIGVSRQTYGAIERKNRKMSWNTFLSLIMFFDYNEKTHSLIRSVSSFPAIYCRGLNNANASLPTELADLFNIADAGIIQSLDMQALKTIKTVIMLEYSRCKNLSGEATIKFFEGLQNDAVTEKEKQVSQALKNIRKKQ